MPTSNPQAVSATQTQTPAITRAKTTAKALSVTQVQVPTVRHTIPWHQALTVTNAQVLTLGPGTRHVLTMLATQVQV